MRLMYITNNPKVAEVADKAGVEWIFVDLEIKGKQERQKGRDTVMSAHTIKDIINVKNVIKNSQLMVRINPLGKWSEKEIDDVIKAGADIIMLPYFKTSNEVKQFLQLTNKRVETCLLVETMSAVENIDNILLLDGINYIHIGLNDIHIERKTYFMFEFLADDYIDIISKKIKAKNIPFGFGGVAHMKSDLLPLAKDVIAEHYRVGSTGVILSRSFIDASNINNYEAFESEFIHKVEELRDVELSLTNQDSNFLKKNKKIVQEDIYKVRDILKQKATKNG